MVWASPTSGDTSIPASMSLYKDKEVLQTTVLDKSELHYYDTQTGRWEYSSYFDKVANEYPVQDTVNYKQTARYIEGAPYIGGRPLCALHLVYAATGSDGYDRRAIPRNHAA